MPLIRKFPLITPMSTTQRYDVNVGETVIEHRMGRSGRTVRHVSFITADGLSLDLRWVRTDTNNITVTSSVAYADLEINLISF